MSVVPHSPKPTFGHLLRQFRQKRPVPVSQSELARLTGHDHSAVSRWEATGAACRAPSREAVRRIVNALRLDPHDAERLHAAAGFMPDGSAIVRTPLLAEMDTLLADASIPNALREAATDQIAAVARMLAAASLPVVAERVA